MPAIPDWKACTRCSRLAGFLASNRSELPTYFNRPVPAFGDDNPQLLIVGLAPGLHGANRTGRPFTGDHAGILLYETLFRFGFASQAESVYSDDGLRLANCRITNAVKCVPPQNKPSTSEINTCNPYLRAELLNTSRLRVVLALGRIAHQSVLRALAERQGRYPFAHGAIHELPAGWLLVNSYHCSRYNLNTGRLTAKMFIDLFEQVKKSL